MKGIDVNTIREACLSLDYSETQTQTLLRRIASIGSATAKRQAFGSFVRERRIALGLDQGEVVERMGNIITPSHISNIENGKSWLNMEKLFPLARALECEAWEFVAVTEEAMKPYQELLSTNGTKEANDG